MNYKRVVFVGYFKKHKSKMNFTKLFNIKKKVFLESSKVYKTDKKEATFYLPEKLYEMDDRDKFNLLTAKFKLNKISKELYQRDIIDFKSSIIEKSNTSKKQKIIILFLFFIQKYYKVAIRNKLRLNMLNKMYILKEAILSTKNYNREEFGLDIKVRLFMFRLKFLTGYNYSKKIIEQLDIKKNDLFIIWGKEYSSRLLLINYMQKNDINYFIVEYGEFPGTIMCNKYGIFGESYPALNWNEFNNLEIDEDDILYTKKILETIKLKQISTKNYTSNIYFLVKYFYENSLKIEKESRKKVIYVNGVELFASGLYFDNNKVKRKNPNKFLLEKVVSYFDSDKYMIIYKDHPMTAVSNNKELLNNSDFPTVNFIYDFDIHDLLTLADYVISYPSKVVITSLLYQKKIFVLGEFSLPKSIPELNYFISKDFNDINLMIDNIDENDEKKFVEYTARMIKYLLLIYDNELFYKSSKESELSKLSTIIGIKRKGQN